MSEWVSGFLNEPEWEVITDRAKVMNADVAIVEVTNFEDELFVEEVSADIPVVVFSRLAPEMLVGLIFDYEIQGIITFLSDRNSIKSTLDAAVSGEEYFDENFLTFLLSDNYRNIHERISSLSKRELEVIDGILKDMTNDEIAEQFNLSVRTVNAHKRNILQKLGERSLIGVTRLMLTHTLRFV